MGANLNEESLVEPPLPEAMNAERQALLVRAQGMLFTREIGKKDKQLIERVLKDYPNLKRLVLHGIDKVRGPIADILNDLERPSQAKKAGFERMMGYKDPNNYDSTSEDIVQSLKYLKEEVGISVEGLIEELIIFLPTLPTILMNELIKISPRSMKMLEAAEKEGEVTEEQKDEIAKTYAEDLRAWLDKTSQVIAKKEGFPLKEIETHIEQYDALNRDPLAIYFLPRRNVLEEFQLLFYRPFEQFASLAHGRPAQSFHPSEDPVNDIERLLLDSDFQHVAFVGHGDWQNIASYGIYGDPYENISRFAVELLSQRSTLTAATEELTNELSSLWKLIDPLINLDDPESVGELLRKHQPEKKALDYDEYMRHSDDSWLDKVKNDLIGEVNDVVEEKITAITSAAEGAVDIFGKANDTLAYSKSPDQGSPLFYSENDLSSAAQGMGESFEPIEGVYRYTCGTGRYEFENPERVRGDFNKIKSDSLNEIYGSSQKFSALHSDYVGKYESDLIDQILAERLDAKQAEVSEWLSAVEPDAINSFTSEHWGQQCTIDGAHLGLDKLHVIEKPGFGTSVINPNSPYGTNGTEGLNYLPQFLGDPLFEVHRGGVELFGLNPE